MERARWGVGAMSLMWLKKQIYLMILPYFWNQARPFPASVLPAGWGFLVMLTLAFIVGAYKVEDWTRSRETQVKPPGHIATVEASCAEHAQVYVPGLHLHLSASQSP